MVMFSRAPACRSPSNRVDHRYLVQVRPLGQRLGPATSQPRAAHARCKAFKEPREQLSAEEVEEWDRCAARLVDLGIEPEQAESILKESYGWVSQKYWKRRMMTSPASESQLDETFTFLKDNAGLTDADLGDVAVKFPQIFGCGEAQLQYAVDTLAQSWRIKGKMLTNSVRRNPTLLGCVIDCYGDCAGDCERCWQRF